MVTSAWSTVEEGHSCWPAGPCRSDGSQSPDSPHYIRAVSQSTYIHRVPQCMSPRRNWDPPLPPPHSPASECALPPETKGAHSPADEGVGGPNSNDCRKRLDLALCLLCGMYSSTTVCLHSIQANDANKLKDVAIKHLNTIQLGECRTSERTWVR